MINIWVAGNDPDVEVVRQIDSGAYGDVYQVMGYAM